jgi:hypothetical protein
VTVGAPVTVVGYECAGLPIQAINLTFSSSDPRATLPAPIVFPGGQGRFLGTVTFLTAGTQTLRAQDTALGIDAVGPINVLALPTTVPIDAPWTLLALMLGVAVLGVLGTLNLRLRNRRSN